MKKLVTAACALVAGLALADGGVTSANTVGFLTKAAGQGYNYVTPPFVDVGYNTYMLGGIVLEGDDVEEFGDNLQIFDSEGNLFVTGNTNNDKKVYRDLIQFLDNTIENEMINFYKNKKEIEFMNKDLKCLFYDFHFKKETGISLLENNGFLN